MRNCQNIDVINLLEYWEIYCMIIKYNLNISKFYLLWPLNCMLCVVDNTNASMLRSGRLNATTLDICVNFGKANAITLKAEMLSAATLMCVKILFGSNTVEPKLRHGPKNIGFLIKLIVFFNNCYNYVCLVVLYYLLMWICVHAYHVLVLHVTNRIYVLLYCLGSKKLITM